jgi:hypothetical protein
LEPPDRLEKQIRFGCGFVFGCFVAAGALLASFWSAHAVIAWCVLAGLLGGYAAMKFGDVFWEHVVRWWSTWW